MSYRLQLIAFLLCLAACGGADNGVDGALRVAVLPDQTRERLIERYAPLLGYLESDTGLTLRLEIPANYTELVERFVAGDIDLALFGGLTYAATEARTDVRPLVMRDTDVEFRSCYIVRSDDAREAVDQFERAHFAFGPRLSTSGHLMPRHFLEMAGVDVDHFFASIEHSTGHDETVRWVQDDRVELGVVNCIVYQSLLDSGSPDAEGVRLLSKTPFYSNYVWVLKPSIDAQTTIDLRDAFLSLDASRPEQRSLLNALGANAYMPASRSDFDDIRRAATAFIAKRPEQRDEG